MSARDGDDIGREILRQSAFVRVALVRRGVPHDTAEDIAAGAVALVCGSIAKGLDIPAEPSRRAFFLNACLERSALALNGKRRRYTDPLRRARVDLVSFDDLPDDERGTVTIEGALEARSALRALMRGAEMVNACAAAVSPADLSLLLAFVVEGMPLAALAEQEGASHTVMEWRLRAIRRELRAAIQACHARDSQESTRTRKADR